MGKWFDVVNYEGIYKVSNDGRIKSLKRNQEKILKAGINSRGYLFVMLLKDGQAKAKTVHRLVAEAFIPKADGKNFINHKDGNKLNNNVLNLEWVTQSENVKHAFETGLEKAASGENHAMHKVNWETVKYIRNHYAPYNKEFGATALSKKFGITPTMISFIANNKNWKEGD